MRARATEPASTGSLSSPACGWRSGRAPTSASATRCSCSSIRRPCASCRGWPAEVRPVLLARWLLVLGLAFAAGCQQRKIEVVVNEADRTGDYGRHALRASVQKFRSAPRSPEAFRAMAVEIDRL